jgi:hypothetical protein
MTIFAFGTFNRQATFGGYSAEPDKPDSELRGKCLQGKCFVPANMGHAERGWKRPRIRTT